MIVVSITIIIAAIQTDYNTNWKVIHRNQLRQVTFLILKSGHFPMCSIYSKLKNMKFGGYIRFRKTIWAFWICQNTHQNSDSSHWIEASFIYAAIAVVIYAVLIGILATRAVLLGHPLHLFGIVCKKKNWNQGRVEITCLRNCCCNYCFLSECSAGMKEKLNCFPNVGAPPCAKQMNAPNSRGSKNFSSLWPWSSWSSWSL